MLKQTLLNHLQQLLLDFDPVKDARKLDMTKDELLFSKLQQQQNPINIFSFSKNKKRTFNSIYLFPASSLLAITIESQCIYLVAGYKRQPEILDTLIARRIFPPALWAQSDVMVQLGLLMATSISLCLLLTPKVEDKFVMYLFEQQTANEENQVEIIQNSQRLKKAETVLIARYRLKMNRRIRWAISVLFTLLAIFYVYSFILTWSLSPGQNYFKLVELILFTAYLLLVNVFMIFYFLLAVRYIRIKQQCLLKRILCLEAVVENNSKVLNCKISRFWKVFKALNVYQAAIHEEIKGHNRYWSKYLSIIFGIYIMEICFFFYSVLFNFNSEGTTSIFSRLIFAIFGLEFSFLLLFITLECSKVVASNRQTHHQLRGIAVRLQQGQSNNFLSVLELLKLDRMVARGKDVASVCFKLINGYRINSSMFQLVSRGNDYVYTFWKVSICFVFQIFYYTSLFFMMIFRRQSSTEV